MAEQIKKRDEIDAQWKWNLTHIFPSDEAWEAAGAEVMKEVEALAARQGHVAEDPKGVIRAYFALAEKLDEIGGYAFLRQETDNGDSAAQGIKSKAMGMLVKCQTLISFMEPELLTLSEEELIALQNAPDMAEYSEFVRGLIRNKPHTLSPAEEKLLAMMGELKQAPDNIFSMLSSVDMTFPDVTMPDGSKQPLSESTLSNYLHNTNQDVRRQAWEGIMSTYGHFGATIAATYGASVKKDQFEADAHHFPSAVEASMFPNEIPLSVYDNLIAAAEKASHTTLPRMVYGLGVAGIGLANAKMICRHFKNDFEAMRHATVEELVEIDGIGEVLAQAWTAFFSDGKNNAIVDHLLAELTFEAGDEESSEGADEAFAGMNFVITGSLEQFKNRKELQELIERRGGKVTGSVTSKTNYLINNDVASSSSKNKKARELGVPILSEEEFLKL